MRAGTTIAGRFEVIRLAASGGVGAVFEACDRASNQRVALKVLHAVARDQLLRFEREARILAGLSHPNIVRYVAHGVIPGDRPYLVMEWLEGEDLDDRLERGPLTISETVQLGLQVTGALAIAHDRGIVHRDIKPANLWLVGKRVDSMKVLDLGLARSVARDRPSLSRTGSIMGTPSYMSPEQARGSADLDVRADIFSLGCVLYECLTGTRAFGGEQVMAVLAKILLEDPPRLRKRCPNVPYPLERLVERMMARERGERPKSASEVRAELETIQRASDRPGPRDSSPNLRLSSLTTREQRVLCVLIAGKSSLSQPESTDSELFEADDMTSRHSELRAIAERHDGKLELLANGCMVTTFSSAGQATDLAAQAARCALTLRPLLPGLSFALATGRALLGQALSFGEAVERASAVLGEAATGEIRVDAVSSGLLEGRFLLDQSRIVRERELPAGERLLLGKPTTCVGREWELGALQAALAECIDGRAARVVLVTAPAGVGKSRLRSEFLRSDRAQEAEIAIALGDPMRAGAPLGLLAQVVCWSLGISRAVPLEIRHKVLRARVERFAKGADAARVTEFLAELIGAPFNDEPSVALRAARQDPLLMADQLLRAWKDWLAAESAAHPMILVFEDVHWGDLPTVKFVDAALRELADRPIFVLALARPEVHEKFPRLWVERGSMEIHLRKLAHKASEQLVLEALGPATNPKIVQQIVQRAEGNAFYLEELVRGVAGGTELPESVITMLRMRLSALPDEHRLLLRAGSIFGGVFSASAVADLLGHVDPARLQADLTLLIEREWISRAGDSRFLGEDAHTFRHDLLREAAYSTLTDEDRALGHRLAADWLVRAGETEAIVIADHYARGGNNERAVPWYLSAAEQAMESNDLEAAIARAERAIECGASGTTLGALRVLQAEAQNWRANWIEGGRCAQEATHLLITGSSLWAHAIQQTSWMATALGKASDVELLAGQLLSHQHLVSATPLHVVAFANVADHLFRVGRARKALELLDVLRSVADFPDNPAASGTLDFAFGRRALFEGGLEAALESFQKSRAQFDLAGDARNACLAQGQQGEVLYFLGQHADAERILRRTLEVSARLGLVHVEAESRLQLAMALARRGQHTEACSFGRMAVEAFLPFASIAQVGYAQACFSRVLQDSGDVVAGEQLAREALQKTNMSVFQAEALATHANALLARRQAVEAASHAERALSLLESQDIPTGAEAFIRLVHARAMNAAGDLARAQAAITRARARLMERARLIRSAELRKSFLTLVPENARILSLAEHWSRQSAG